MGSSQAKLVVIKIGTNVITNNDGFLDASILRKIVSQVSALKERGTHVILVSSGAMAAGNALLKPSMKTESVTKRQMLAAVGQASLMGHYMDAFKEHGYLCAQVLTTKEDFRTRAHYLNMKNCFAALLQDSVVPIVNENDVIAVEELMFTDNDELAGLITSMVNADALLILTSVEGVMTSAGNVIAVVPPFDAAQGKPGSNVWKEHVKAGTSQFGKGGMHTKCAIAEKLAATGIGVHILPGRTQNVIAKAIAGDAIGTYFQPTKKVSNVKRWIAHAEGMEKGTIVVNDCAADILLAPEAVSLLPVGIIKISGEFEKGDIIEIRRENGDKLGLGKAQYGAERVREVMGKKGEKALIHYDYLFVP